MLTSTSIMQPLDWGFLLEIMCDASDYAVKAMLGQKRDNKPCVIYCASQTLNGTQMNYSTIKKQLLAIVFAFG